MLSNKSNSNDIYTHKNLLRGKTPLNIIIIIIIILCWSKISKLWLYSKIETTILQV